MQDRIAIHSQRTPGCTKAEGILPMGCIAASLTPTRMSLEELLQKSDFRKRTAMYLGKKDLSVLQGYVFGYWDGLDSQGQTHPLTGFHDFVANHYGRPESTAGWKNIIVSECQGDEEKAVDVFFTLYDQFRAKRT